MSGWLALDLSKRSTGWAFWNGQPDQTARFGTWDRLASEHTPDGQVCLNLHKEMHEHFKLMPFDLLFYEEPIQPSALQGHTNIDTLTILSGLAAHARSFAAAVKAKEYAVNISSWRKTFIGSQKRGTPSKELKIYVMERCRQLGFSPRNYDEADAIGVLTYGILLNGVTPPWLAAETLRQPLTIKK